MLSEPWYHIGRRGGGRGWGGIPVMVAVTFIWMDGSSTTMKERTKTRTVESEKARAARYERLYGLTGDKRLLELVNLIEAGLGYVGA